MIILHNPHSKESRAFVAAYGDGCTVIDWYNDPQAVAYFTAKKLLPSAFPALVDETAGVIVSGASHPDDLANAIANLVAPVVVSQQDGNQYVLVGDGKDSIEFSISRRGVPSVKYKIEVYDGGTVTTETGVLDLVSGNGTLVLSSTQPGVRIILRIGSQEYLVKVV